MALTNSQQIIQALKNRVTLLAAEKKRLEEKCLELQKVNLDLRTQLEKSEAKPKARLISEQPRPPAEPPKTIVQVEQPVADKPKKGRTRASL